jgi:hypothetical protein
MGNGRRLEEESPERTPRNHKRNIKWDGLLGFKEYPWRTWTKIESSTYDDKHVLQAVWEAAGLSGDNVNSVLLDFLHG